MYTMGYVQNVGRCIAKDMKKEGFNIKDITLLYGTTSKILVENNDNFAIGFDVTQEVKTFVDNYNANDNTTLTKEKYTKFYEIIKNKIITKFLEKN